MVNENLLTSIKKIYTQTTGQEIKDEYLRTLIREELNKRFLLYINQNLLNRSSAELMSILEYLSDKQNGTKDASQVSKRKTTGKKQGIDL